VSDVDVTAGALAFDRLCAIPGTIRCRILY
jgi:hypothetical protein